MRSRRRAALMLLVAACFAGCGRSPVDAQHVAAPNSGDLGHFVVAGVLIDPALDNMQQRYFRDDPRLLGRLITIAAGRVGVDGDPPCTQVQRRWTRQPVDALLRAHSQRRGAAAAKPPRAADYGLTHVPAGPVATVQYQCTGPDSAKPGGIPGHVWSGAAGFALEGGRRALLWEDEVVLLLQPVTRADAPRASFACNAPKNPTERTICADPVLAGWDRSVAAAYLLGMRGSDQGDGWVPTDDPAALQASQRDWITERDRCGTDHACLIDRMYARTDALMRRQYQ